MADDAARGDTGFGDAATNFVLLALAANKCVETSGRIFYQAAPCPANTRGGDMQLNVNRPFAGQVKSPVPEGVPAVTSGREDPPINREPDHAVRPEKDAER